MSETKTFMLAIDCALRMTNAALISYARGGECETLSSLSLDIGRRQAEELPLATMRVLSEAGLKFADVSVMAVTNGPGYFTGVRIGAAYAAALAYALGLRIIPVSTLEMLAYPYINTPVKNAPVLSLVYAGYGRVYAASFGAAKDNLPPGDYGIASLESWLEGARGATIVSDDPQKVMDTLENPKFSVQILLSPPDAVNAARIALRERAAISPADLRVSYLREPKTL
ncbi:tRNA (adenosine(37)-N6)-threonylcarbamoyltransferase complex dimerization subunit type 1 TsaB [Synergistales bacterium]|nr:tRNA (adenosine(37)-N6)-threonylcarbamoyltransferase complex dimerization subunit type 1 TsaB [Synergistales bacterium]